MDYISVPVVPELLRAKVKVFAELHRKSRQLQLLSREMQQLSKGMIKLRDEEQHRLARELHDGLGQELGAAKMTLDGLLDAENLSQAKEKASEAAELIKSSLKQVRRSPNF